MDREVLYQAIFKRKSIKKFEPAPLDADTLSKVEAFLKEVRPMFSEVQTELRVLPGAEVKSGLMKPKYPHYVAIFSDSRRNSTINAGFMLQQVDLFLSANGIGSLWLDDPSPVNPGKWSKLEFVIFLAFGRAAEPLHRASVSEFDRKPLDKISDARGCDELLEPARLAPSAMNNQPWFFGGNEKAVHVHINRSALFERYNKLSTGAAICHAWLAAAHFGKGVEFDFDEKAKYTAPKDHFYLVTMRLGHMGAAQVVNSNEQDVTYSFEVQVNDTPVR